MFGLKLTFTEVPKSQQYYNGWVSRESTTLAPRGTKAKSAAERATGNGDFSRVHTQRRRVRALWSLPSLWASLTYDCVALGVCVCTLCRCGSLACVLVAWVVWLNSVLFAARVGVALNNKFGAHVCFSSDCCSIS